MNNTLDESMLTAKAAKEDITQDSSQFSCSKMTTDALNNGEKTNFGDPLVIANDFEMGYIHHYHLTGTAEYHDPVEYLKVYLNDNRIKITQISIANIFFALLLYLSLLDVHDKTKEGFFNRSNVFHLICVSIWTYTVFISIYSVWKVRKFTSAAQQSLDRDAENTDLHFLSKSCQVTHSLNILMLIGMLVVLMDLVYKALVVFGVDSSKYKIGQISQMEKKHLSKAQIHKGHNKANLPN